MAKPSTKKIELPDDLTDDVLESLFIFISKRISAPDKNTMEQFCVYSQKLLKDKRPVIAAKAAFVAMSFAEGPFLKIEPMGQYIEAVAQITPDQWQREPLGDQCRMLDVTDGFRKIKQYQDYTFWGPKIMQVWASTAKAMVEGGRVDVMLNIALELRKSFDRRTTLGKLLARQIVAYQPKALRA